MNNVAPNASFPGAVGSNMGGRILDALPQAQQRGNDFPHDQIEVWPETPKQDHDGKDQRSLVQGALSQPVRRDSITA